MDDLIAFLNERLDEDERSAKVLVSRAHPRRGVWTFADMKVRDEAGHLVVKHTWPDEGEHIARHDPSRVLREVEAKRRILDREVEKARGRWRQRVDEHRMTFDEWAALFRWDTLRLLASAYADHLDYREEWRP